MTTDYRALCDELKDAYAWCLEECMRVPAEEDTLIQRARAALAQPEPHTIRIDRDETGPYALVAQSKSNVPTAAELRQIFLDQSGYVADEQAMLCDDFCAAARAVLARYGVSTSKATEG